MRKMSSLARLTYEMHKVTPRSLWRRHQVHLVASSIACERWAHDSFRSAEEIASEGDGMCLGVSEAEQLYALDDDDEDEAAPSTGVTSNIVALPKGLNVSKPDKDSVAAAPAKSGVSPADLVTAKLSEAASFASALAASHMAAAGTFTSSLFPSWPVSSPAWPDIAPSPRVAPDVLLLAAAPPPLMMAATTATSANNSTPTPITNQVRFNLHAYGPSINPLPLLQLCTAPNEMAAVHHDMDLHCNGNRRVCLSTNSCNFSSATATWH